MSSLADQIIEHGPLTDGELALLPLFQGGARDFNALRDELIEGRRLKAAAKALFDHVPGGESDFWDDTDFANWHTLETVVAGLVRRADDHTKGCA
jgi:hypothetical protein